MRVPAAIWVAVFAGVLLLSTAVVSAVQHRNGGASDVSADADTDSDAEVDAAVADANRFDSEARAAERDAFESEADVEAEAEMDADAEADARAEAEALAQTEADAAEEDEAEGGDGGGGGAGGDGDAPTITITYCSPCGFYQHVVKLSAIMTSRFPKLNVKLVPNERMNYAFEVKLDDDIIYNQVFGDGWVNSEQTERLLYLIRLKFPQHWPGRF